MALSRIIETLRKLSKISAQEAVAWIVTGYALGAVLDECWRWLHR
jgi:hypothetical protein